MDLDLGALAASDSDPLTYRMMGVESSSPGAVLMSLVERATGKERTVLVDVHVHDGRVCVQPVYMLLDRASDTARFEPPADLPGWGL